MPYGHARRRLRARRQDPAEAVKLRSMRSRSLSGRLCARRERAGRRWLRSARLRGTRSSRFRRGPGPAGWRETPVEILPDEIRLTLGVRDVLVLENLDDVPQIFGPTLMMPGQSFRLAVRARVELSIRLHGACERADDHHRRAVPRDSVGAASLAGAGAAEAAEDCDGTNYRHEQDPSRLFRPWR